MLNFSSSANEPESFALEQNYPNPFNPSTIIRYSLPREGVVTLKVYNVLGQEVATLLNNEKQDEGEFEVEFNASTLSSGVYFYRMNVNNGEFVSVKKLMLLK